MNELSDSYDALKALAPAAQQLLDLLGIVEHALMIEADVPALETKKAALTADIAKLKDAYASAYAEVVKAQQDVLSELEQVKALRTAEMQGLEKDKAVLKEARSSGLAALDAEMQSATDAHHAHLLELRAERQKIQDEIAALQAHYDNLAASLKAVVAAVPIV
jgi:chromosome segregation ATPase